MSAALDDYRWLISAAAAPWLAAASQFTGQTLQLIARLRRDLSAERAALVVQQVELRRRARDKFSRADVMFFTPQALEQASGERLARYKAGRFTAGSAAADLCCGIGGDLLALAERGPALGVDLDPALVLLADANLAATGVKRSDTQVVVADAAQFQPLAGVLWHCDPDRRATGWRTTQVADFSPAPADLDRLLAQQPAAAIKLAPATLAPSAWADRAEREWLGTRGECQQQVAWFGSLARHAGQCAATVLERDAVRTVVGAQAQAMPLAAKIGPYVYEPHAAVLAAKLAPALCTEHDLAAVSAKAAYLTGDRAVLDLALDAFEVRDVLPLDKKRLKAYCREHRLGRLEIKKRGVDVEPGRLARELGAAGDRPAVILLTPAGGQVVAIVAHRYNID